MAQRKPTEGQWQTLLDAVRIITEMDGLDDMVLISSVPAGGFLEVQELRTLLDSVKAAVEAKRQEARVGPCEAACPEDKGQPPEKP